MKNNQELFTKVIFPDKPSPIVIRKIRNDSAKIFTGEPYCNPVTGVWMADISQTPNFHSKQEVIGLLQKCDYSYFETEGDVINAYYAW